MLTFLENLLFGLPSFENVWFRWHFVWETFGFVDLFLDILNQFNWFYQTSPSKSIDSVTCFMKTSWLNHQSIHLEKELNRFNQFCGKNESIQINQLSRVDWYTRPWYGINSCGRRNFARLHMAPAFDHGNCSSSGSGFNANPVDFRARLGKKSLASTLDISLSVTKWALLGTGTTFSQRGGPFQGWRGPAHA